MIFVYLIFLGVGFLFTLISAAMGHVFGHSGHVDGSHGSAEAGADASDMPGVSAFSPTIIACFVAAFGGLGVVFSEIKATKPPLISASLSMLGAFCIAGIVLALLRSLFAHTQGSSEGHIGELVGVDGIVISPIPEGGVGEIAYVQGGCRYTAPARELNGQLVSTGKTVKIARIVGSQFYVTITNQ